MNSEHSQNGDSELMILNDKQLLTSLYGMELLTELMKNKLQIN
jgi:hypothetical protein